jgi:histidine phosphotransfer protein HptB
MSAEDRDEAAEPVQVQGHKDDDDFSLADLIPQYFALCRRDLLNLRAAIESKEFDQVRVLGHNLKGSGGAYGFPELSEIGAQIESAAKTQDTGKAGSGVARLAEFLSARNTAPDQP